MTGAVTVRVVPAAAAHEWTLYRGASHLDDVAGALSRHKWRVTGDVERGFDLVVSRPDGEAYARHPRVYVIKAGWWFRVTRAGRIVSMSPADMYGKHLQVIDDKERETL